MVGSTAQSDRTPSSDLDLMVLVRDRSDRRWLTELGIEVAAVAERGEVPRTEYVVYDDREVASPRYPLNYLLNVNAGPELRSEISTHGDPAHWFLLDVAMARHHAITLIGPPADVALGEPTPADIATAITDALDWHDRSEGPGVNTVLNACRGWRYLAGEGWASKSEAARWAATRWDGDVIDAARRSRVGGTDVTVDAEQAASLVQHVRTHARQHAVESS